MPAAGYRCPVVIRATAAFLGVLLAVAMVANGAVTLLDVAARASYTTRTSYAAPSRLAIKIDEGRVELVRAPAGGRLTVRARVTGGLASPDVRRTYEDGNLTLDADCPIVLVISCGARWTVGVPDGTAVGVDSSGGDIAVDGVRARGTLRVRSSAGDVRVTDVGSRRVDASSSAGDVHVELSAAPTELRAESSAGDVHVVVPDVVYDLDASTSAGDRRSNVRTDPESRRRLVARSSAGDVDVEARGR
ncbi:hypothetical protein DSM112329_05038 [Paraconexibacter sp. AEG42_29]|uniref:DUF4097 domain-containing protein n=1 Tax=Paraconexibacter sp. AEG42_29 TaxID=2997339 RepID=A0AAU7B2A5_9ACTN